MKKYIVVGAGVSGRSAIRYLQAKGASVILYDDNPAKLTDETLCSVTKVCQIDELLPMMTADDQLVLSPAIAVDHPLVQKAKHRQLNVCSEVELGLTEFSGRFVAVTGTNGKSTVVAMINHLLQKLGQDSCMVGNIGLPVTAVVRQHEILVLELSSFQLEQITTLSPEIAVLTNLADDHLDRHDNFEQYSAVKQRLLQLLANDKIAVIGAGVYPHLSQQFRRQLMIVDYQPIAGQQHYLIDGQNVHKDNRLLINFNERWRGHHLHNALLATICVQQLTAQSFADLVPLLDCYQGLPYRLQLIGYKDGHPIINDAKATNLTATISALKMQTKPVILMLGGHPKKESFAELVNYRTQIVELIVFGQGAPQLTTKLSAYFKIKQYNTLAEALPTLNTLSAPLLFSPACASDNEFADFKTRGAYFTSFFTKTSKVEHSRHLV